MGNKQDAETYVTFTNYIILQSKSEMRNQWSFSCKNKNEVNEKQNYMKTAYFIRINDGETIPPPSSKCKLSIWLIEI